MSFTLTASLGLTALCLAGGGRTAAEDPTDSHLGGAHLERVLAWTEAERQAASDAAARLQQELDAAVAAGASAFRIPPGDYTDWKPAGAPGHRCILSISAARGMEITATGATFWSTSGAAVVFDDCRDCTVRGLTVDTLRSPFVQGVVREIVADGHGPGWDRVWVELEPGFFPVEHLSRANSIGRTFRQTPDGRLTVTPRNLGPVFDPHEAPPGCMAWFYRGDAVADKAVGVGDRLAVHVKSGYGGVAVIDCGGMVFRDLTVFSSGSFCVWEQGTRAPGGNRYERMRIVPRPGSTRIGVGAQDGFHSFNQARGPVLIDCEIARTCDDGVNIHGFVNVVLAQQSADTCILASVCYRDYDVGTELTLNRGPSMAPLGTAEVAAWEPFDQAEGARLYAAMQARYRDEFGTTVRGTIRPEFCVVRFTRPVELQALDTATSHDYCGRGTRISGLTIRDGCNRGLLVKAPDSIIENSHFEAIPWGGLFLATGITNFLEGGFLSNVRIRGNVFENCGERAFGEGPLWACWGAISLSPCLPPHHEEAFLHLSPHIVYSDIEITGNRIRNTQGLPIFVGNTRGVTVADNVIVNPFQAPRERLAGLDLTVEDRMERAYAPPVPAALEPLLREPFYGIFLSASTEVVLDGNRMEDPRGVARGLVGIGPWVGDVRGQGVAPASR